MHYCLKVIKDSKLIFSINEGSKEMITVATINELGVSRRDAQSFTISSWRTSGPCARVSKWRFGPGYVVTPYFIPSYMNGITNELIEAAVEKFVAEEAGMSASNS